MENFGRGGPGCDTENLIDPDVENILPIQPSENVAYCLLLRQKASLQDLVSMTDLPKDQILGQIAILRRKFSVRGNRFSGYKLSDDPEKRLALSRFISKKSEERIVRT
jgi:hypothetical protein